MSINVPKDAADGVRGAVGGGENNLPYAASIFYVVNGLLQYPQTSEAFHYGGWCTGKTEFDELCISEGRTIPSDLHDGIKITKDGKEVPSYTSRSLILAPFGERDVWKTEDGKKKHTLHVLALLGVRLPTKEIAAWGPIVLKSSGWQASNLRKAFQDWEKATGMARTKFAGGAPSNLFWSAIGTFGPRKAEIKTASSNSQGTPITPITVYIPENTELTEAKLQALYVGDVAALQMVDYRKMSQEWIEAKHSKEETNDAPPNDPGIDDFPPPVHDENEIPF
jgi:hypothetical protein